ncbi:MAG: transporter substrate-binding domain-containing protein [Rhodobacteraceae bacterium]|jgi:ABC-type amino acid transport substrate-binding protein|nr:transporter substrate-binding domain-containing protein [Paracoccaceae bacterium]
MTCTGSIAAFVGALTLASAEPTIIGTTGDFPPFTHLDAAGQVYGLDADIGNELCRRLVLRCTWVVTDFDQLIPGLMAGEYDFVIGGMASSDERWKIVDFTSDYQTSEGVDDFVGRPGAPGPDAAMIGVQSGTIHERHLEQTGRRYQSFASQTATIAALQAGKVDLIFGSFSATTTVEALQGAGFAFLYSEAAGSDGPAIAVCKGNQMLLERLESALQAMLTDGTIDAMSARWN